MKALYALAICLLTSCMSGSSDKAIEQAVEQQFKNYPLSTLQDVYKNFFQNRFGPGHIISDTHAAEQYLQSELASPEEFEGAYYEAAGADGSFYRVNLSVIREQIVPYDLFFDAFIRSAESFQLPPIEEWEKEWKQIEKVVGNSSLRPEGFTNDSIAIAELLASGEYVMHHSPIYSQTYRPHYRIIEKSIFEKELLPLIKKAMKE